MAKLYIKEAMKNNSNGNLPFSLVLIVVGGFVVLMFLIQMNPEIHTPFSSQVLP